MILLFKLLAAPVLIAFLTLLSRRFGPTVGGLMMGVPLVTGPISVFTAIENGNAFAQRAAVTNLVGQVSTCMFCLCYAVAARRLDCWRSAALSLATFFGATLAWSLFDWSFPAALVLLLVAIVLMLAVMRPVDVDAIARVTPRFDLLARMAVSTGFVMLITVLTGHLGPSFSGLVAPFPVFVLILSVFTHRRMGPAAAANLVRGVVLGSFSFATFFTVVALWLPRGGIGPTYAAATLASVAASAAVYLVTAAGRPATPTGR